MKETPVKGLDPLESYSRVNAQQVYAGKRRKKTRLKRTVMICLCTFLGVVLACAAALGIYIGVLQNRLSGHGELSQQLKGLLVERKAPSEPFYCLLLGTDGRPGETKFRSDTIILARVDPGEKKVTLISIPRDTPVQIPGHGTQKINAAHAFGGPSQAVQSVSEFTGVKITHYLEVSFEGFQEVVDALGGVELDVPDRIQDKDAGDEVIEKGYQKLNGAQALTFCRSRKFKDGDYSRMRHQRLFVSALADTLLNKSNPLTLASTVDSLSRMVLTDMSVPELLGLIEQFKGMNSDDIMTGVVPSEPKMIKGVAYVVPNMAEWQEMMNKVNQGLPPTVSPAEKSELANEANKTRLERGIPKDASHAKLTVDIRNGSMIPGAGGTASSLLKQGGYKISGVRDIDKHLYDVTEIRYRGSKQKAAAEKLASELKLGKAVKDDGKISYNGDLLLVIGTDWERDLNK